MNVTIFIFMATMIINVTLRKMYDVYLLGLLGNGYHNMDQLRTKLTKVIMDQTTIHTNVASDY